MTTEERKIRDFGLIFYLWFILVIAAYGFGIYSIIQLAGEQQELVDWITDRFSDISASLGSYIWWAIGIAGALFIIGVVFAYLQVWLMSYIGAELVNTVVFGIPVVLTGAGIASFFLFDEVWIGIVLIVPAIFLLVIALLVGKRVILGSKIFEMSNEAVNDEKGTLLPVLFFAFMSIITFTTGIAAAIYTGANINLISSNKWVEYLVFFLLIYVYLAIHWTMLHFSDAINICIFKRWNNYKDSSISYAMKDVWKIKGSIVLFGMFMAFFDAIIKTIQFFASRKFWKKWKQNKVWATTLKVLKWVFIIFVLLLKWLFKILKFLNYYTLTIIVVEKQGFVKSMIRSADLSLDSAADVIIGKTGVNIAKGLFTVMTFGVFSAGGFFLGYYWLFDWFANQLGIDKAGEYYGLGYNIWFSLAIAAVFFFFGYLPTTAILRPISTAYKTILFFYIADPFRGHPGRRTRLTESEDINENLERVKTEVMETYDKEDRPIWNKPEEAKV